MRLSSGFLTKRDISWSAQAFIIAKVLKFQIKKLEVQLCYPDGKKRVLVRLFCVQIFAYAKMWLTL